MFTSLTSQEKLHFKLALKVFPHFSVTQVDFICYCKVFVGSPNASPPWGKDIIPLPSFTGYNIKGGIALDAPMKPMPEGYGNSTKA